jgi:hypothetical protein
VSTSEQHRTSETVGEVVYLTYDKRSSEVFTSELERAGYQTKVTASIGETILCLRKPVYLALVVGPLVQAKDRRLLTSELRRRGSNTKIIFLSRDGAPKPSEGYGGADAVLNVQNGPESLVRALNRLLSSKQ